MVTLSVCAECKGKGKYKVFNAYDPDDVEEVLCEHCDGDGLISMVFDPRQIQGRSEDDWAN